MGQEQFYLTRVRGLATVIWDPKRKKPLAEFNKQGLFCTTDADVVEKLVDMGYRQVDREEIVRAGLVLPEMGFSAQDHHPGRGYSNNEEDMQILGQKSESPVDALFDPPNKPKKQSRSQKENSGDNTSDDSPRSRAIVK